MAHLSDTTMFLENNTPLGGNLHLHKQSGALVGVVAESLQSVYVYFSVESFSEVEKIY